MGRETGTHEDAEVIPYPIEKKIAYLWFRGEPPGASP
jgi:hypothetical protein